MALTKVPSNLDAAISVTQSAGDNSTKVATTSYVDTAISALSDSAPAALNTLNEIAAALGDDANYASTTTTAIAEKLPLAGGTMTGALIVDAGNSGLDIRLGTDKRVTWSGGIGEIGSVAGFQAINTAGSALASFGIRGTDLRFATGSAERMRITDAGINVTGTVQADNLTMLDSEYIRLGASNDLQIFHDGNHSMIQDLVGTGALKIKSNDTRFEDADGNNIIKATSTAAELYFSGGKKLFTTAAGVEATAITTTGVVNEFTTSSSWGRNLLLTNTNNDVSPPIMTFLKSPAGGHTQMADNDYVGFINFRADNSANQEHSYVEISVRATDVSDGSEDSKLTIGTWGDGTEYGNTLVASSGKVGIGTTDPANPLSISVAAHGLYSQHRPSSNTGTGQEMYYKFNTVDNTPEIYSSIYTEIESSTNGAQSGKIALRAAKAGSLTTGLILIGSTGNVGIGTDAPQHQLSVKAANAIIGAHSTGDGQRVGFQAKYLDHGSLYGSFEYTTGDARLWIDNNFVGNNGIYSDITFRNCNVGSNTLVSRMTIKGSTGNVGIGTTTPASLLDVGGGLIADPVVRIDSAAGGDPSLVFDTGAANRGASIKFHDNGSTAAGFINYLHNGDKMNFGAGSTTGVTLSVGDGKIGIGLSDPRNDMWMTSATSNTTDRWGFGGASGGTGKVWYTINQNNAGVYIGFGNTSWTAHSDERIKENIVSLGTVLPDLMNMRCVKYNRFGDDSADRTKIGFIAQDWETNFPEIIDEMSGLVIESDGTLSMAESSDSTTIAKGLSYTETIPVLLKAIQEQQTLIENLTARIASLEG